MNRTKADAPADRPEMIAERIFDAPRETVFAAWSDPDSITHWWGPRGFTTTTHEMDFRSGGTWRFTMHGPDGTDYGNLIKYEDVVAPERIVYAHSGEDETNDVQFHVTVTFADDDGKTRMTFRMIFESIETRDRVMHDFGALEGLYDTLDRLAEHMHART